MRLATIGSITLAILLLTLPLLLAGCGGGGGDSTSSSLSGSVQDAGSHDPIAGATVSTGGRSATTNTEGFFTLPGVSGAVRLSATAPGYKAGGADVPAGSGNRMLDTPVRLVPGPLPNTANITGRISLGGQPAEDAVVRCAGRKAVTDSDGNFTLYNVPLGAQTVFASGVDARGNVVKGDANVLLTGAPIAVDIQLTTPPPQPPPL